MELAVEDVRRSFAGHQVDIEPEDQGGAYVVVHELSIGEQYEPSLTWVGFLMTFQYPRADVYPHFLCAELRRRNGAPLGNGFSGPTQWRNRQAIQVSRRSNRWNPVSDTAAIKLTKVLEWLRSQ